MSASPIRPAPTNATRQRFDSPSIDRNAATSSGTLYPRPRFPNVPKNDRSFRTCAAVVPHRRARSSLDSVATPSLSKSVSNRRYNDRRPTVDSETFFTGLDSRFVNGFTRIRNEAPKRKGFVEHDDHASAVRQGAREEEQLGNREGFRTALEVETGRCAEGASGVG